MSPRYYIFLAVLLVPVVGSTQPAGYYNNAYGKTGEALRQALYDIVKGHTPLSYTPGLWDAYYTTDVKPGTNKLYTIYSDKPGSTPPYEFVVGADQCGSSGASAEGGCYNREHIWPRSKFGGLVPPMNTDLWIVYPTDYVVNNKRGDLPYGKVNNPTQTFKNGSKIGPNVYAGAPTIPAFEPIDSFKGDIARSYFYISTRYYADSSQFSDWEMARKSSLKPWAVQMLLDWHRLDPVSAKEKNRNEAVYAEQANRNPFIDEPKFAECIWAGNCVGLSVAPITRLTIQLYPNPARGYFQLNWPASQQKVLSVAVTNMLGQQLYLVEHPTTGILVSTDSWDRGLYIVVIQTSKGTVLEKLVVE